MAIYHFHAQVISRKAGRSSTAAAAYRAGEKIEDQRTGEVHDYTRKSGVAGAGILAPADSPAWVFDRSELWNQVELAEKRKDAQVCREIDAALPVELSGDQRIEAVRLFVEAEMVSRGMVVDVAFHDFDSANPHCHIMLTMRDLDPNGFGKKNRTWNDREMLHGWREKWADYMNRALARAGEEARIDHRSYEARGLDWEPAQHVGPAATAMERRTPGSTRIGRENRERWERNLERELISQEQEENQIYVDRLESELDELEREISVIEWDHVQAQSESANRALEKFAEVRVREVMGRIQNRLVVQVNKLSEFFVQYGFGSADQSRKTPKGNQQSDSRNPEHKDDPPQGPGF